MLGWEGAVGVGAGRGVSASRWAKMGGGQPVLRSSYGQIGLWVILLAQKAPRGPSLVPFKVGVSERPL